MMIMPDQRIPWNKGLTKETDIRVTNTSISIKKGYENGRIPANLGKRFTEEHKRKISKSEKGKIVSKETRRKISIIQKGRKLTPEWRKNISKAVSGKKHPLYGKKMSKKSIEKMRKSLWTPKHKKYMRKIMKDRFKDEEWVSKFIKSVNRKPNKKEILLSNFLKKNNFQYKFVGDYSFWMGGKNPDFVNVNGQKKVIELFGDYWHNLSGRQTPKQRINHFRKYGFDCLIIWESEMKDMENVLEKIMEFDNHA